jgi:hypothetical protein
MKIERHYHPLRLAVGTAALGMSIGISPVTVLAVSENVILAADSPTSVERLGAELPKVEQPGAEFQKIEQPGAEFQKVERPGAAFPKVERPGAEFQKVER